MTGFRHAPVSKAILIATAGASILSQAVRASRRGPVVPGILTRSLVFRSPAELLFGALVMYYFRVLERQSGSGKFGAFAAASTGLSAALQWAASAAASRAGLSLPPPPSGPYGLLFACFVQYWVLVPPSARVAVLGWRLSDKLYGKEPLGRSDAVMAAGRIRVRSSGSIHNQPPPPTY
ncbi:hypothetical protein TSOC_008994 [Tetrabaena socialis]|uniref:Uncharacterized protein n=1 Tax=Tetrabaena socialis TaxID=47790 RepID=A0A2J7ZX59_9CHLO|nr:hypothetical protein TSOC_008994 [Tetrabaena socialis]|eukprot:PNH04846.1 hypothetical protein TSOC_008994 [Tetrabaena socialis]